jgi:hypothetical protein
VPTTLFLLLTAPIVAADPKPGGAGTAEYKKAADLVQQLGHPQYAAREAAAKQLVDMGHAALAALRDGATSDDAEVRARSAALVPRAKAAEWKRRADAYVADAEGKQTHDLPLLADWDKLVGKPDAGTRALFAEVVRTNGDFLEAAAADRKKAAEVCAARCEAVFAKVRAPTGQLKAEPGDLAAVLFVESLSPVQITVRTQAVPAWLLRNPGLAEALDSPKTGPAVRRLVARWAEALPAKPPVIVQIAYVEFADLARKQPFPEAVPVLAKMAKDKTTRGFLIQRLLAVEALGAVGGKEAAAALAELVPDATVMFRTGGPEPDGADGPPFGDQALAASLRLHGKKVEDYGLTRTDHRFVPPFGKDYIPMAVYGFPDAAVRAKAIKRWRDEVAAKDGKK